MTYTVSSGTLNPSIPYRTHTSISRLNYFKIQVQKIARSGSTSSGPAIFTVHSWPYRSRHQARAVHPFICWRHPSIQLLLTKQDRWSTEPAVYLCRRHCQVDGRQNWLQLNAAKIDPVVQLTSSGRWTAKSARSHLRQLCRSTIRRSRPGRMDWQRLDHVHAHHQGRGRLLPLAMTTAQRTTVSVARVFYMTRGCPRASAVGLLQWSPGWTSCQSTQPTAVCSAYGSTTHLRHQSIRPRYTTAVHWLSVPEWVTFKLCIMVYRCLHDSDVNPCPCTGTCPCL